MEKCRFLLPNEIECRIGRVFDTPKWKGVSLLLYKDARVDMALLDERFGAENWMRDHKEIKGNLFCGVGVKFEGEWIWKWDCGTESNTEKEKGEASDSFKRACVLWGQGRELYTAPLILVSIPDEKIWNGGKPKMSWSVVRFGVDEESGVINDLVIVDKNMNVVYNLTGK